MILYNFWSFSNTEKIWLQLILGLLFSYFGLREMRKERDEVKKEDRERLGSWIAELIDWFTLIPRLPERNPSFAAGAISFVLGTVILVRLAYRFLF